MRFHIGGLILLVLLFSLCSLNANAFNESPLQAGRSVRSLSATASLSSVTNYYNVPVNANNTDPFCYGRTVYSDSSVTSTSTTFSFIFQFIHQANSSTYVRNMFSLDNGLASSSSGYIMIYCFRGAYNTNATISLGCSITIGGNTIGQNFTSAIYQGNLVSLYVGLDLSSSTSTGYFYLYSEGTNTSESYSVSPGSPPASYVFPNQITIGTSSFDLTNCSRGLQVIKARYYTGNYFDSTYLTSVAAAQTLFQDDGVISLAIMAPPTLGSGASLLNLGQSTDPTTIILGSSLTTLTNAPSLSSSSQAFTISTTRGSSCNLVSSTYLTTYTKIDFRNVVISLVFQYVQGSSNQIILQRFVNSLKTVDFILSYDYSNTRFTVVLNGQTFSTDSTSFPVPTNPSLYTVQILTGYFNQITTVTITNVATGAANSNTFNSELYRNANEVFTLYVGEYIQQSSLCNSAASDQNGQISLSNLVITAGQFNLTTTGCKIGCAVCGGLLPSNYNCFACSNLYSFDVQTLSCTLTPACQNLGTLDVCQTCSISSCTYCTGTSSLSACNSCAGGYTIDALQSTCQAGCKTSSLSSAGCIACDSINCYTCGGSSYLYKATCVSTCPAGYFANSATQICEHCATNCSSCTSPAQADCTTCLTGYQMTNGICQLIPCGPLQILNMTTGNCDACPNNTYYLAAEKSCRPCNSSSLVNSSGVCIPCALNQFYNATTNTCYNCSLINQFFNSTTSTCQNCSNQYQIWNTSNNQCQYCPLSNQYFNSTIGNCTNCSKANQFYNTTSNSCQNCTSNMYYTTTNNSCVACGGGNSFFDYTNNICTNCSMGNQFYSTTSNSCQNCTQTNQFYNVSNGSCFACGGGNSYFNYASNTCTNCSKANQLYSTTSNSCQNCTQTNQFYNVSNGSCASCGGTNSYFNYASNACANCSTGNEFYNTTSNSCQNCTSNMYYTTTNNSCVACGGGNAYFNYTNNTCANCSMANQYYSLSTNSCQTCSQTNLVYNVSTNSCVPCGGGNSYFSNSSNGCTNCSMLNQFWNISTNSCQNCSQTNMYFSISSNSCALCGDGSYFFNYSTNQCVQCPAKNQFYSTSSGSCQNCSAGLIYNGTNCTTCPLGDYYYDPNSNACIKCSQNNQYFNSGSAQCVYCNASSIFNESKNSCVLCGNTSKYYFSNSSNACTACQLPNQYFNMASATCVSCTPSNMIFSNSTNSCVACGNGAWFYNSSTNVCAKCPKINMYWSTTSNQCLNCSLSNQYYNGTSCTNCGNQNVYYNATSDACVVCPQGNAYWNTTSNACQNCSSPLMYFNGVSNACSLCQNTSNNFFNTSTNSCAVCPLNSQYFDTNQLACVSCPLNQIFNISTNSCAFCYTKNQLFAVQNNSCVSCSLSNQIINTTDGTCVNCSLVDQFFNNDPTGGKCSACSGSNQYYNPTANGGSGACVACAGANQYFSGSQNACQNCSQNSFYNLTNNSCALCGTTRTYFNTTQNACKNCTSTNQYFDMTQLICVNCSIAYQVFNDSMNVCTQCFYNNSYYDLTQGSCTSCPQTNQIYNTANFSCILCGLNNTFFNKSKVTGGLCDTCPYSNQIYSLAQGKCVACGNGNTFFNSTINNCDICPLDNMQWNLVNSSCIQPNSTNLYFDTGCECFLSCGPNFFFNQTNGTRGGCQECPFWYQVFSNTTNNCTLCPYNNMFFNNQTGSCGTCSYTNQNFSTATGLCQDCPLKNMYFSTTNNSCIACPFTQQIYNKTANGTYIGSCVYCPSGNQYFSAINNSCVMCNYTNQYWNETAQSCVSCSLSNQFWNTTSQSCQSCLANQYWDPTLNGCKNCTYLNQYYTLSNNSCVYCRPNQYFDMTMSTPACKNCPYTNQLYNQYANVTNAPSGCQNCNISNQYYNDAVGTCVSCANNQGYSTSSNSCWNCSLSNQFYNTTSMACQACLYASMYFSLSNNNCTACLPNQKYNLANNSCINCNPNAFFSNPSNSCISCNLTNQYFSNVTYTCTNCSSNAGYSATAPGYCQNCSLLNQYYNVSTNSCSYCTNGLLIWSATLNQCVPCAGNQYFNYQTNTCMNCTQSNQYWDPTQSTTNCQTCPMSNQFYNTSFGSCYNCSKGNQYYQVTNANGSGSCTTCATHFANAPYNFSSPCQECANNQIVDPVTGYCTLCPFNAFYDSPSQSCKTCPSNNQYFNPGPGTDGTGSCNYCLNNQLINLTSRTCQNCAPNAYYNATTVNCTNCTYSNQYVNLTSDGTAVCYNCSVLNAYFNATTAQCVNCLMNQFYNLTSSKCQNCPGANQKFNYITGVCDSCPTNFIWNNVTNTCTYCGNQMFYSSVNQSCMPCATGCANCTGTSTNCQLCMGSYYRDIDQYLCVQSCPTSGGSLTFGRNDTNFCVVNGSCPNSQYANISTGFCELCNSSCSVCYGPTSNNCTRCADSYYLLGGTTSCDPLGDFTDWENSTTWPNNKVPGYGEDVTISAAMNVLLSTSVAVGTLTIQGQLNIITTLPLVLNVTRIYIQGGTLTVGSPSAAKVGDFTIFFTGTGNASWNLGLKSDSTNDLSGVDWRNNVFINIGKLNLYSELSTNASAWTRLASPLSPEDTRASVRSQVQWIVSNADTSGLGNPPIPNTIVVTSSSFSWQDTEELTVSNISDTTIDLDSVASNYHHGTPHTSGLLINGAQNLSLAAEVGVRSHCIRIISVDPNTPLILVNTHQVVTTTSGNSTTSIDTYGNWNLYGVGFENVGDLAGKYGAINILGTNAAAASAIFPSYIVGCTIWKSKGPGFVVNNSQSIYFQKNFIYQANDNAIKIINGNQLQILQNLIVSTQPSQNTTNLPASFYLAPINTQTTTVTITMMSNIVVGDQNISYLVQADDCSNPLQMFLNNAAHSGNIGWLAVSSPQDCALISQFQAYKMSEGVIAYPLSSGLQANSLILSDNRNSLTLNLGFQGFMNTILLSNSLLVGLGFENCSSCYLTNNSCSNISGIRLSVITLNSLSLPRTDGRPLYAPTSNGIFYQRMNINGVTFKNFFENITDLSLNTTQGGTSNTTNATNSSNNTYETDSSSSTNDTDSSNSTDSSNTTNDTNSSNNTNDTNSSNSSNSSNSVNTSNTTYSTIPNISIPENVTCSNNRIFVPNTYAFDYIATHYIAASVVQAVALNSVFNSTTLNPLTPNSFSGDTGVGLNYSSLYNYLIVDTDGSFFGNITKSSSSYANRTIIPNNPQAISRIITANNSQTINSAGCIFRPNWNGYDCDSEYGSLTFSSLGSDRYTSKVTPIYVNFSNLTNVMTNGADYSIATNTNSTSSISKRIPQWTAIVQKNQIYSIKYTNNTPTHAQYQFQGATPDDWIIIQISLTSSKSVQVMVGNKIIPPFIKSPTGRQSVQDLITKSCGTNIFQTGNTVNILAGQTNPNQYLEIYLDGSSSCIVNVQFITGTYLVTELTLDFNTFMQNIGTDSFKQTLSQTLNISPTRISIYSLAQGSTIVEYVVSADNTLSAASQLIELQALANNLITASNSGTLQFEGKGIEANAYMITSSNSSGIQVIINTNVNTNTSNNSQGGGSGGGSSNSSTIDTNQNTGTNETFFHQYGLYIILGSVIGLIAIFVMVYCCCMRNSRGSEAKGRETASEDDQEIVAKMRSKSSGRVSRNSSKGRNPSVIL